MAEKLTWDEIKRRHPDEWVALVDYEWPDDRGVPDSGVVYAHSPDHARLMEMHRHLQEAAIVWTGKTRAERLKAAMHVDSPV